MMEQATRPPLDRIAASIRRERERAGLSLSELARSAGLAKSTLSQLESGTGNPSLETLWALSVALDVPFSRLIDQPPRPRVTVLRRGEGDAVASERAHYVSTLLASCPPGARRIRRQRAHAAALATAAARSCRWHQAVGRLPASNGAAESEGLVMTGPG